MDLESRLLLGDQVKIKYSAVRDEEEMKNRIREQNNSDEVQAK